MDPRRFLFPIVAVGEDGNPTYHRGNAFPLTADGGLLTCSHVVSADEGARLAVLDQEANVMRPVETLLYQSDPEVDLAFLPRVLCRESARFPLMTPGGLLVGHDVYTYGFYSQSGRVESMADGYFKGNVVSFRTSGPVTTTLSYPVIEGLSGSPVLMYHHGTKLVGICHGSESQRVLAYEVMDVEDGERRYRESVSRIVEFGLAYRSEVIEAFCSEIGVEPVVTDGPFDQDELG